MLHTENEKDSCSFDIGTIMSVAGIQESLGLTMVGLEIIMVGVLLTCFIIFVVETETQK